MDAKLTKSGSDRVIDGVCGGLAEYFGIDAVLVRAFFVLIGISGGTGVLLYLVLVVIMPAPDEIVDGDTGSALEATIEANVQGLGEELRVAGEDAFDRLRAAGGDMDEYWHHRRERSRWLGIILLVLGLKLLTENLNLRVLWLDFDVLWPVLLIAMGAWLLKKRARDLP